MNSLPWMMIGLCTVGSFAFASIWHGPLFGKMWGRIHGMSENCSDAERQKMMVGIWKIMLAEFIATLLIIISLACLIRAIPSMSGVHVAFMVWVGFILPMTVSNVVWGNDPKKWMCAKIAISTVGRLISLLAVGYLLSM
jgi:Protein of unknown function (DUF1761)